MTALTKEQLLSHVGKLKEELAEVEGLGEVLCRELTGANRAKVLQVLTPALTAGGTADLGRYQQMLLQLGLVDAASSPEARQPLFDFVEAERAMQLGAGVVEKLCSTIERLSGLDKRAAERAEGNSSTNQSSTATSE